MVSMSQATSSLVEKTTEIRYLLFLSCLVCGLEIDFYYCDETLPVGNAMKIAHTSVLCAKASTWTDIARVRRSQFIGKNCFAFGWLNFHLNIKMKYLLRSNLQWRMLTFRIIYFSGTVGNICLIADARSVIITSAFCFFFFAKKKKEIMIYSQIR